MVKNALIVANLAGFASFLIHDIEILIGKGYSLDEALENGTLYEDLYRPYVEKRDNKRKVNFMRD